MQTFSSWDGYFLGRFGEKPARDDFFFFSLIKNGDEKSQMLFHLVGGKSGILGLDCVQHLYLKIWVEFGWLVGWLVGWSYFSDLCCYKLYKFIKMIKCVCNIHVDVLYN